MAVLLTTMVAAIRKESGLGSNPLWSDADIIRSLEDARSKLRDIFIDSKAHWFRSTYSFTLTEESPTLDLSLIPDLQMDQYLNRNPDNRIPEPVTRLGSLAERAQVGGVLGVIGRRKYDTDGDVLTVYPRNAAPGDYELVYTSMGEQFALPVTTEFELSNVDHPDVPPVGILAGTGSWSLANAAFNADIPEDESVILNLSIEAPNAGFSGAYPIVEIGLVSEGYGLPSASCNNLGSTSGFIGPLVGTGNYTYQPIGTRNSLPQVLTPWQLYLKSFVCIKIRDSRNQENSQFAADFKAENERATRMSKSRTEGIRQAPMTRGSLRWPGPRYGGP